MSPAKPSPSTPPREAERKTVTTISSAAATATHAQRRSLWAWLNSQMNTNARVEISARRFGFWVLSISTSTPPAR